MSSNLYSELGFDNNDIQVYSALVSNRVRSVEEISILTKINEDGIQISLQKLIDKEFIRLIEGKVNQYLALAPPIAVTAEVNKKIQEELEAVQKDVINIWKKGKTDFNTFLDDLKIAINNNLSSINSNLSESLKAQLNRVIEELEKQQDNLEERVSNEKANVDNSVIEWKKSIGDECNSLNEHVVSEVKENHNLMNTQFIDQTKTFQQRLSTALGERSEMLSTIIEQSSKNLENIDKSINETVNQLNDNSMNTNDQINNDLSQIIEREKKKLGEITDNNLEVITNLWDNININVNNYQKHLVTDNDNLLVNIDIKIKKIKEKINYFKNISNEEFLSVNTSGNMILGQMQASINENISTSLVDISENLTTIFEGLKASVNESNSFIEDEVNKISTFVNEEFHKYIDSIKNQLGADKENLRNILSMILTKIDEEFQKERVNLEEQINSFGEEISKVNRDLTEEIPRTFDDNIALLKDNMNNFDRQIRGNLNTIGSKLSSVKEQIDIKLSKRFSGKGGLEEIKTDIEQLIKEYSVAQNRIHNMIEDQMSSLDDFNQNLTSIVNKKLRENDYRITKLIETTSETLTHNLSRQLKSIKSQITSTEDTIIQLLTQKELDLENNLSNLNTGLKRNFDDIKQTFTKRIQKQNEKLSQMNILPNIEEIKNTFLDELGGSVTNVEQTLQNTSQSGANRLQEVIDDGMNVLYDDLKKIKQNISSNKENARGQFSSTLENFNQQLSDFVSDLKTKNSNIVQEISTERTDSFNQMNNEFTKNFSQYNRMVNNSKQEFEQIAFQLRELLDLNFLNLEKTITNEKALLINDVNQNFSAFSEASTTLLEKTTKNYSIAKNNIVDRSEAKLNEIFDSYTQLLEKTLSTYNSERSMEKKNVTESINSSVEEIKLSIDESKNEFTSSSNSKQEKISNDLIAISQSLPNRILKASEDTGNLTQLINEVQKAAIESPDSPIDQTYLIRGKSKADTFLNAVIQRTKSTIQIMTPILTSEQIDLFLSAGTRKRVQILTGNINSGDLKRVAEAGNFQIKKYDSLAVFGVARDGSEEAALGTGDNETFQMIATTNTELIGALKEIFQDLWPRGRNI